MVLVPLHVREELRCLLNFMRVAAEEDAVRLSIKVQSRFLSHTSHASTSLRDDVNRQSAQSGHMDTETDPPITNLIV